MATARQNARGCRHFRGVMAHQCEAGHVMRDMPPPKPCIWGNGLNETFGQCPDFALYSETEIAEQERQADEAFAAFLTKLNDDICPHCNTPIARKRQVGRCVYAEPCGHRLYQGRA